LGNQYTHFFMKPISSYS